MTVTGIFSWPRWIDSWPLPAIPTVLWRRPCYRHDYLVMDRRSTATLICDGQPGVTSISRPLVAERDRLCPPARRRSSLPNTACLRGAGLRKLGSRRMASCGESWNCLLEAAGAFVVALAARRSWFCCRQLFGCCCGSGGAVPRWLTWPRWAGRFLGRALVGAEARGRSPLCWPPAGPGRPLGGGRVGLAA